MKFAEIFLNQKNKRIDRPYDYAVPKELQQSMKAGLRVVVFFGRGNRKIEGFVIRMKEESDFLGKTKKILEMIDKEPILTKEQISLCLWMKTYYCSLFYENLSLFTASVKLIKKTGYRLKKDQRIETLPEHCFVKHYFEDKTLIKEKDIEEKDASLFKKLLEKGVLKEEILWEKPVLKEELVFKLTQEGRNVSEKKTGVNQQKLLRILSHKTYSEAELKLIFGTSLGSTLKTLERKGWVSKEAKKNCLNLKESRSVILSQKEEECYQKYRGFQNKKTLFHVFDPVSKYRLYFKAIEDSLKKGKTAILMFPEVNMTLQRIELFSKYFGDKIGLFHGKLSSKERYRLFKKIENQEVSLIIGVRSALFLPIKNLGLIIIDEAHDESYTAMTAPRYHLRDLAEKYSELTGASLIVGDDIPDIATYYKSETGELNRLEIGSPLKSKKKIQVVDMQKEIKQGNFGFLSSDLTKALEKMVAQKKLSVLLINKRGYASCLFCRECGEVEKCPYCGVSLNYFQGKEVLSCHYCTYQKKIPVQCSHCGSTRMRYMGFGIDQAESLIKKKFPSARILSIQGHLKASEIKKINQDLIAKNIDILIGTHILTKHFNLSEAGLAATLLIDGDLNQGKYRGSEKVFQIYQRFFEKTMKEDSLRFIQTNEPSNETIDSIVDGTYQEFYTGEIDYRRLMQYPPIMPMIVLSVFQKDRAVAEEDALKLYLSLKRYLIEKEAFDVFRLYKPTDQSNAFLGNQRFQIVLKVKNLLIFQKTMTEIIALGNIEKLRSKVSIEINP